MPDPKWDSHLALFAGESKRGGDSGCVQLQVRQEFGPTSMLDELVGDDEPSHERPRSVAIGEEFQDSTSEAADEAAFFDRDQ